MRKRVVFVADSLDNAHRFQQVLSHLDVEVAAGSTAQMEKLLAASTSFDLVVFEARGKARASLARAEALLEDRDAVLLLIVNEANLDGFAFPASLPCDFVLHGAGQAECAARVRKLLRASESEDTADLVVCDSMTINLATYQVSVAGEPVDFTFLEYSLLAFLAKHPGRTFSRDALLKRVWGFDYYGGSRTVDVHVRRIRAKLGPDLAQRLETVRSVGYLWNA